MSASASDFKHSDLNGVVSFRGKPVAVKTKKGWSHLSSGVASVDKAVNRAISGSSNNIGSNELRRTIVDNLD